MTAQEGTGVVVGHSHDPASCGFVTDILSRIGDKWTVQVIVALEGGMRRFSDLMRTVPGISQRMLTLTLKGLERDGFVTRTVHATVPPRVDYELTPLGATLIEPVSHLGIWARAHAREIAAARSAFDLSRAAEDRPPLLRAAGT